MSYTPNDLQVYTAAFSGCVSGITNQRRLFSSVASQYNDVMRVADAYAQEVDGLWNGTPTWLDIELIWLVSNGEFANRFPNPTVDVGSVLTSTYTEIAKALIALLSAANSRFSFEGALPPAIFSLPITDESIYGAPRALTAVEHGNDAINSKDVLCVGGDYALTPSKVWDVVQFSAKTALTFFTLDGAGFELGNNAFTALVDNSIIIEGSLSPPSVTTLLGGGKAVFVLANAQIVPSINVAGVVIQYAENDILKYRRPNGVIETVSKNVVFRISAVDTTFAFKTDHHVALNVAGKKCTLPATADIENGFVAIVSNISGGGVSVAVDGGAGEVIYGVGATLALADTQVATLHYDKTNLIWIRVS